MKKCIVISDSFKGTLSSMEICQIAKQSIPTIFPSCEVIAVPVADGGEGTVDCFIQAIEAIPVAVDVTGPYGEPIRAVYARKGEKAIIEMACAAGLPMVGERRDPSRTTTYGVGQVIRHAVEQGCREILLGLGGSLDVYAGTVKRAPKIFIRLGLEWFYRLLKEPWRIGRMMRLPQFYFGTWRYKFTKK